MILSMTGFGQASGTYKGKNLTIEIRSLNGKLTDLRLKLPSYFKEKEIELRKIILDEVIRGKIDVTLTVFSDNGDLEYGLNKGLFEKYYGELRQLKSDLAIDSADMMQSILRIPNVIQVLDEDLSDAEWNFVRKLTLKAIKKLNKFRAQEGIAMAKDLESRIHAIVNLLEKVDPHEASRLVLLRERLSRSLAENLSSENIDANRFEQEILFYLEKLDINEEKVRLAQHCRFFLEALHANSSLLKGKKLGFISQEIGREINTMGAKAQNSDIQRLVVEMKDELEKIKEQIANIV